MPVEQVTLIPCLRELKTLGPWQKRRAASKNVDQGTKRHAGCPVLAMELWDEQVPSVLDLGDLCGWGNDAVYPSDFAGGKQGSLQEALDKALCSHPSP